MSPEMISCKLSYDKAKGKNYIEVSGRQPLLYHAASFRVRVLARTEAITIGERSAGPQLFSQDVVFSNVAPGVVVRRFTDFPTPVHLHSSGWSGAIEDMFSSPENLAMEPQIIPKSIRVEVFEEQIECQNPAHTLRELNQLPVTSL